MVWQVQACAEPEHWIYQVSQGDILISPEGPTQVTNPVAAGLIASDRTIQSLKKVDQAQSSTAMPSQDPWVHHDPWQPRAQTELPPHQYASMKAEVEKTVFAENQARRRQDADRC